MVCRNQYYLDQPNVQTARTGAAPLGCKSRVLLSSVSIALFAAFNLSSLLCGQAIAAPAEGVSEADADKVASEVLRTYRQVGMLGLSSRVRSCYSAGSPDLTHCVKLDLAARYLEGTIAQSEGSPKTDYFASDRFYERAATAFAASAMDAGEGAIYISVAMPVIENSMNMTAQRLSDTPQTRRSRQARAAQPRR
jgi:hypothetical protein